MKTYNRLIAIYIALIIGVAAVYAQDYKPAIRDFLTELEADRKSMGPFKLQSVSIERKTYKVYAGVYFLSFPFREDMVDSIERHIARIIAPTYPDYKVEVYADGKNIRSLIPNLYLKDKNHDKRGGDNPTPHPFVRNLSKPYTTQNGLTNRNIAVWQSHGWYYDQKSDRWAWQRARLFTTVEDKFSLSFVMPYLVPMLENAGANVLIPRERDMQRNEIIVDNDTSTSGSIYKESGETHLFRQGGDSGFAWGRTYYINGQNPFTEGTYRTMETSRTPSAFMEWVPEIPESGFYAVTIAYKTKERSVDNAHYTVYHADGKTEFSVNQTMGGGTWIYLGTFYFKKGINEKSGKVVLSNASGQKGMVTADAVRFGGGMGNIGRRPAGIEELTEAKKKHPDENPKLISCYAKDEYTTSGRARFWEGSRYWLQWAGAPEEVYSHTTWLSDYTDDYASRGAWVNWLNNGSVNAPDSTGLRIPIDLSLAFHTDAGCKIDTVVGTLGIYSTIQDSKTKVKTYPNGKSREMARDFTDIVQSSVCEDIIRTCEPDWQRRWMWDKAYSESRIPDVPAMILELLSHQNFDDMQYGLDPRFKFLVSRAAYKGVLRFISEQYGQEYVVQPLPVKALAAEFDGDDSVRLTWRAETDTLEATATPQSYVVYTRTGNGWDNGIAAQDTTITLPLKTGVLTSYKVVAVNKGGASMDSEILSVYNNGDRKKTVLIINGFDRISGPEGFKSGEYAGFPEWTDHGVPDRYDIQYVGGQYDFNRTNPWISDDNPGWGASYADYETDFIAGNSFDYPALHGFSIANAGFSFVSCSRAAAESKMINLRDYKIVDLVLGEQKSKYFGTLSNRCEHKTFSLLLQGVLSDYTSSGGALFVSGANVVSDLWNSPESTSADKEFARRVLKAEFAAERASKDGRVSAVYAPNCKFSGSYKFSTELNDSIYEVENADALKTVNSTSFTFLRYDENSMSAAVAHKGRYRSIVCGFPFEAIMDSKDRNTFMRQVLRFLTE